MSDEYDKSLLARFHDKAVDNTDFYAGDDELDPAGVEAAATNMAPRWHGTGQPPCDSCRSACRGAITAYLNETGLATALATAKEERDTAIYERDTLQSEVELLRGDGRTFITMEQAVAWLEASDEHE